MTRSTVKATASSRRSGVQSIDVGSRLLDVLAAHPGPMHLRDIASAAGMSSSKAHRYLISLLRAGLAEQDPATGRYDLGAMSLRVGLAALSRRKVVQYATQAIIELNQAEDLTVALTIWGTQGPTIVGWYDSSQILICNLSVGAVLPLLRSAAGQVFLAYLPRETTRSMVERDLNMITTYLPYGPIRTKNDVEGLVQRVRKAGVGMTNEDLVPGLSAFAAPVFDHQGCIVASISLIGPSGLVHAPGSSSIGDKLLSVSNAVSLKLGYDATRPGASFVEKLERGEYAVSADPSLSATNTLIATRQETASAADDASAKPAMKKPRRKSVA